MLDSTFCERVFVFVFVCVCVGGGGKGIGNVLKCCPSAKYLQCSSLGFLMTSDNKYI